MHYDFTIIECWWRKLAVIIFAATRVIAGLLVVGLMMAAASAAVPNADYSSRHWLVDDGLPHNVVNRIVQDGRGFLWVATAAGLVRYDGREFREFAVPTAVVDASSNVRDLVVEDASTLLMLPAAGGIVRLRDGAFSYHPASAALTDKTLLNVFAEPGGTLWLGLGSPNIVRWEAGRLTAFGPEDGLRRRAGGRHFFAMDGDKRVWISSGDFLGWYRDGKLIRVPVETKTAIVIASARSGGLWVATEERLLKWENDRLTVASAKPAWLAPGAAVQQLYEDRAGVLWIGTRRQGLFRLVGEKPVPVPTEHYQIAGISEDAEANIWVSMDGGGINRLRAKTFVVLDGAAGLPDDISTSVCEDALGAIWLADRGGGAIRMLGTDTRVFSRSAENTPIYASNVCPDRAGNIWIGAVGGLYRMSADASAPMALMDAAIQPVRALYCTREGDMWVSSGFGQEGGFKLGYFHDGIYHALSEAEGFQGKHVSAINQASDGAIWIGTHNGELLEFRDGKFLPRLAKEDSPVGSIHGLHFDERGSLWIGTERGLLLREDGKVRRFSRADGLPDDQITQILQDEHGRLWICGRRGFFSVATGDLRKLATDGSERVTVTTFGREEGLPGISSPTGGQPMSWKARDGKLWFATNRGAVGFDPEASLPQRAPPSVYIDQTLIDGRAVATVSPLLVSSGSQRVEFRFAALNYSAPEKVRLRHQLVGFDSDWVDTNADRAASYARLPPGSYSLHVIAANQDGVWNERGAVQNLTVVPTWWQTWWFRAGMLLGFTASVAAAARHFSQRRLMRRLERLEREHALEQERSRIARDLHDDLGGSLTQIGLLADRLNRHAGGPELKTGLRKLAWRTRHLAGDLESIVWTVSPKNNTWDRLAAFIAQSARRFFNDTGVECSVEGAELIPSLPLAPDAQHHVLAVVKEAMNNVLKHSQAARVDLAMAFSSGCFELRLRDNGVGFDAEAREHAERNGLANMRARAMEIGGTLEIASRAGEGAELVMRIPQAAATAGRTR